MSIADQFILQFEGKLINGQWLNGRYDMAVINDLRIWGAKPINIIATYPSFEFSDGSKCLWNNEFEDWFLV